MAFFEIGFVLEGDAKRVDIRWRRTTSTPWAALGEFNTSPATIEIAANSARVEVQVRPLDASRRPIGSGKILTADTDADIVNRDEPFAITPVDPVVEQDGPVLTVKPTVPAGIDPDEFEVEVRTAAAAVTAEEDATHVGFVAPGEPIKAHVCPGQTSQKVFHRLRRLEDGRSSDWLSTTVELGKGEQEGMQGHTNDFASGSIVDRVTGFTPLEVSGGDLQFLGLSYDDLSAVSYDDLSGLSNQDLGVLPTEGAYRTETVELDVAEDLQFQVCAEMTSHGSTDFSLDEFDQFPMEWLQEQVAGFVDERIANMGLSLDGDLTPVNFEVKVATSATASPTFTANDYTAYKPGEVRRSVRAYAIEIVFLSPYGSQFTIDKIDIRHWIFCKARPWCLHSNAAEKIHETVLTGLQDNIDITVVGAEWDYLVFEVDWTGGSNNAGALLLHFNLSASNSVVITTGYAVNLDSERVRFRVYPKVLDRRRIVIEDQYEYAGLGGVILATGTAGRVIEWNDTSTEITGIRVTTDKGSGNDFDSGTIVRVWSFRHHALV